MPNPKLNVAVAGLGFGDVFVPLYLAHPYVDEVTVFEPVQKKLEESLTRYQGVKVAQSFQEILDDPGIDAVHVCSPLLMHAAQSVLVLDAGKHCACAVTMGMSIQELRDVIDASDRSNKSYMMMETGVYTREFLYARGMRDRDEIGKITLLRGDYYQDLEAAYQDYWRRVPPMLYATHVTGPILAMAQTRATRVSCLGANHLRKDICDDPLNPFPFETAMFQLEGSGAVGQVNRAWYQTSHEYVESFSVYGEKAGFEWSQLDTEDPVVYVLEPPQTEVRWRNAKAMRVETPLRPDLFPAGLAEFADGWHGGSHPHLVHEFLSAILEGRQPFGHARMAADWCAVGICAHESALRNGEWVEVPGF